MLKMYGVETSEEEESSSNSVDSDDDAGDENQDNQTILTKQMVKDKKLTLKNLVKYLSAALKALKPIENAEDIVLAIGNTGCGKSTMIISLLYGHECLEEKAIQTPYQTKGKDG